MTTIESLLSWESRKLDSLANESGDVAKVISVFREFLLTVGDERQRFAEERGVLTQQAKVSDLNAEQRCTEFQNKLFELSSKLNQETIQKDELVSNSERSQNEVADLKKKLDAYLAEKSEATFKLQSLESDSTSLKLKLEDALRRLHYKEEELQRLNGEWESVSAKESELSKLQAEARSKLSDVESREVSLKFREERLNQEKNIVSQQNTWLTDELTAKTDELSKLRQTSTEISCKLKSELAEKTEEAAFLAASNKTLKDQTGKLQKRVSEVVTKLQDKDSAHLKEIENTRLQLNKQERLTQLYSNNCEEYQTRIKDLTTAVTEMQGMIKRLQEDNLTLEQQAQEDANKHGELVKELETKMLAMQNELENANDLILSSRRAGPATLQGDSFDVSQLSSTAVTVGAMMKSGMTIVQMYSSYVEATEQLALEKDKNRLQQQYLDQILKEIEEKAPLLQQQRADYENALLNQDNLAEKLETSMAQVDHYRIACEEAQNAFRAAKRENERFRTQVKDLGQQVQVLIREVEDARAGRVSRTSSPGARVSRTSSPAFRSPRTSSSSHVISDQLVSFRSVAELQQQNQRLLCVVRDLSEEQEKREVEDEDPKIVELRAKLEAAADQAEELKLAQQRQVEMVSAVARQRDMYRVLLSQAGHNMGNVETKESKTTVKEKESKHELALTELQREFQSYKVEKRDQIALVQELLDGARTEHSAMLAQKTQFASRLEFADEKYKILENTHSSGNAEIKQYKDKCTELSSTVTRLHLTNDRLQNETMSSRDELAKLRHSLEGQRKTVELLRVNEIKQRTQNEALIRESRTQNMLMANLHTIHNNLERQEFERKERRDKKQDLVESLLTEARRKIQSSELRYSTTEAIQNSHNRDLKASLEKERAILAERQAALDTLQAEHTAIITERGELRAKIETLEFSLQQQAQGVPSQGNRAAAEDQDTDDTIAAQAARLRVQANKITELQHKLIEMSAREDSLKSQVALAKQHAQQYKEISEAHELALKELTQSEQSVKSASEQLMNQNTEEIFTLTEKLGVANEDRVKLQQELEEFQSKGCEEIRQLSTALTKTQHQLEESRQKEESAISLEQDMRSQLNKLNSLYDQAQAGLADHRSNVASLEEQVVNLTRQAVHHQERVAELASSKTNAEAKLDEDSKVWHAQKVSLEQERDTLKKRTEDLDQQNTLLHSQLSTLSKDVVDLQKALACDQPIPESSEESSTSTEELWEIIRYVRREKDILTTKIEVADSESVRYKTRCQFLESQLDETRKFLEEERTKSHSSLMSTEQHQVMLKRVEESQALAGKLKLVTEEKNKLQTMAALLKKQSAAYEKQIKPIKANNRELNDKISILQTEKEGLAKDVSRWSDRCNELIEQANKIDAKEFARMKSETTKLRAMLRKKGEEHGGEVSAMNEAKRKLEEEGNRISEEKRQLLATINSMKAEGTKLRMDLKTTSSELSGASTQLETVRREQQELATELEESKKALEIRNTEFEKRVGEKDKVIEKIRALAKKYKALWEASQKNAESGTGEATPNKETEEKLAKAMNAIGMAKKRIQEITIRNSELEAELGEARSSVELMRTEHETLKMENERRVEDLNITNAELTSQTDLARAQLNNLESKIQEQDVEMSRQAALLVVRAEVRHAETSTVDMLTLDQFTNTEDTPTASVKPTASASVKPTTIPELRTPTAAVRPTSIAPDLPPRMAAVTPTTSVHQPISSAHMPNVSTSGSATTQVSSSSVMQGQDDSPASSSRLGESSASSSHHDNEPVTTGEVRAMLRTSPRIEPYSSGAGYKRARCDIEESDGEQPGPSTKIAMVTSSAHVQHNPEMQASSEVSQSDISRILQSVQPVSQVSSSELDLLASSSRDAVMADSAGVTSSEVGASVGREIDGNEATARVASLAPTDDDEDELMNEADHVTSQEDHVISQESHVTSQESHVTSQSHNTDARDVQVIEVPSDSDGTTEGSSSNSEDDDDDDEDVYSGLDEVEEENKQLQFSFVQSSGAADTPVDILDTDSQDSLLEEETDGGEDAPVGSSSGAVSTSGAGVRSLRSGDTPWAHLQSENTSDSNSQPSSSSNVRSIRIIKRPTIKKE